MPHRLILVRHAEPEMDMEVPASAWPLSFAGRAACVPLAEALAPYSPDTIVTSQQRKAFETGRILAENLFVSVEAQDDLHEMRRDKVGWLGTSEFEARLEAALSRPDELVFGDETASAARDRMAAALQTVLADHPGQTLVVVTHGTVMSLFVAPLLGVTPISLWHRLGLPAFVVLSLPDMEVEAVVEGV